MRVSAIITAALVAAPAMAFVSPAMAAMGADYFKGRPWPWWLLPAPAVATISMAA